MLVESADVASMKPTGIIERFGRRHGVVEVAQH